MFPKLGVPQNGWFVMEDPIKMDDLGGNNHYFRKHPYVAVMYHQLPSPHHSPLSWPMKVAFRSWAYLCCWDADIRWGTNVDHGMLIKGICIQGIPKNGTTNKHLTFLGDEVTAKQFAPENRPFAPRRKPKHLPTIHFQG